MQDTPPIPGVSIRRRLAVGGMGELFLADETLADGTTRPCVVKRLLPGVGAEERRLFAREAMALAALARLGTPHVVKVYRSGPDWILLEWVEGVDLATLLEHRRRRGRPLPLGAALAVAEGLIMALQALAEAVDADGRSLGLVHRDVHPGNVLLGRDGSVKLADLGVVAMSSAPTVAGLKGTLLWMAPEQLQSGQATAASDLYAAGLVVYEALTGHVSRPVGSIGLAELMAARNALPPAPRGLRPELSAALEAAILAPLAPSPAARPTPAEWHAALLAAAAPAIPRPAELAALVADVPAAIAPAQRTAIASAAPAPSAPRRGWALPLGSGLVAVLVALVLWRPWAAEPAAPDGGIAEVSDVVGAVGAVDAVDAAATIPETDTRLAALADLAAAPEADIHGPASDAPAPAPDATRELADAVAVADAEAPKDTRQSPHRDVITAAAVVLHRVAVGAPDGPVHVRGQGVRGLAPISTPPLPDGDALALHLTGGMRPVAALVRVRVKGDRVVASIGAPEGLVHRVDCGGRVRETPLFGVEVPAAGVTCRLEASDGGTMSFSLSDIAR